MSMYTWRSFPEIELVRGIGNIRTYVSYAIQGQYSASKKMLGVADQYQDNLSPAADFDLFYQKIFDIYTAEGVGLDNWGVILQIPRTTRDEDTGQSITLNDTYYRLQLLYKALANISASTAEAQNRVLSVLVGTDINRPGVPAYVLEVDTMVIRWVFETFFDPIRLLIFKNVGTLLRGAGVGWELYALDPVQVFGFDGSGMNPFNQAPFAPDDALVVKQ